jgi:hypothetical protein
VKLKPLGGLFADRHLLFASRRGHVPTLAGAGPCSSTLNRTRRRL